MTLVIGGAYQGKLDYVLEKYPGKSIYHCNSGSSEIDVSADVINAFHLALLSQIREGMDVLEHLRKQISLLEGKIIICDDITCGIVPIDEETRQWRETVGRSMALISKNASRVIRVFCGIGSIIK